MVGDGTWLTVSEAARRLGFYVDKVREFADDGYLLTMRPPTRGKGHGHRRILAASVDELAAILKKTDAAERQAALEGLKRRNAGETSPE